MAAPARVTPPSTIKMAARCPPVLPVTKIAVGPSAPPMMPRVELSVAFRTAPHTNSRRKE